MALGSTSTRTLIVTVPGSPHRLEARLHSSAKLTTALAVIGPPHPMYGGTIDNPVVRAMERVLQRRGLDTLAFNFRGTGESEGEQTGAYEEALADYLGATGALPDAQLHWLSGYSFGSVAALATAVALDAPRVLLVGPPLGMLDPMLVTRFRGQLAVLVGSEDEYAPVSAVRALFEARAHTTIEVLPGVDHFFLGSDVQRLVDGLTRLLERCEAEEPPHAS